VKKKKKKEKNQTETNSLAPLQEPHQKKAARLLNGSRHRIYDERWRGERDMVKKVLVNIKEAVRAKGRPFALKRPTKKEKK